MLVAVFSGTWLPNSFKTNACRCSPRFSLIGCNFGWPLYEVPHSRLARTSFPNIAQGNFFGVGKTYQKFDFWKTNRSAHSIDTAFVLCQCPYEHQHKRLKQKTQIVFKIVSNIIFWWFIKQSKNAQALLSEDDAFSNSLLKKTRSPIPKEMTCFSLAGKSRGQSWIAPKQLYHGHDLLHHCKSLELLKIPSGPPTCGMPGIPSTHRHTHTLPSMKLHTYTISSSTNTCAGAYTPIGFLW